MKGELCFGVPHVVPSKCLRPLDYGWLEAIDAFSPRNWIDGMYALGLAIMKLRLSATHKQIVQWNVQELLSKVVDGV
jgi:hypothetical protein